MFEAISGRSKSSNPRKRVALLTALGAHAAVIGGLLLAAQWQQRDAPIAKPDPILRFPVRPPITGERGRPGPKPAPTKNEPNRHPPKRQIVQPRSMPADPASVPIEPETVEAPAASSTTPDAANALTGPGNGAQTGTPGGDGQPGAGEPSACPAGAVCSSSGEQVFSFNGAMSRPRASCNPPTPSAPYSARQFGLEGRVVAQYVVHADGRAELISAMNSDAPPVYVEAVRQWLEQCSFQPAQMGGEPRSVRMIQVFNFKPNR